MTAALDMCMWFGERGPQVTIYCWSYLHQAVKKTEAMLYALVEGPEAQYQRYIRCDYISSLGSRRAVLGCGGPLPHFLLVVEGYGHPVAGGEVATFTAAWDAYARQRKPLIYFDGRAAALDGITTWIAGSLR